MAKSSYPYQYIDCQSVYNDDLNQEVESAQNIGDPLNCLKISLVQSTAGFKVKEECEQFLGFEERFDSAVKTFLESNEGSTVLSLFREFLEFTGLKCTISAFEEEKEVAKYFSYFGRTQLANDLKLDPDAEGPLIVQVLSESAVHPSVVDYASSDTQSSRLSSGKRIENEPLNVNDSYVLKMEDGRDETAVDEPECQFNFVKVEDPLSTDSDSLASRWKFLPNTSVSHSQPLKRLRLKNNPRGSVFCPRPNTASSVGPNKQSPIIDSSKKSHNKCCFQSCGMTKRKYPHLHFFKFPVKRPSVCKEWLRNCAKESLLSLPAKTLNARVVCEKHFTLQSFTNNMKRYITKDAIPTLLKSDGYDDNAILDYPSFPTPTLFSDPLAE